MLRLVGQSDCNLCNSVRFTITKLIIAMLENLFLSVACNLWSVNFLIQISNFKWNFSFQMKFHISNETKMKGSKEG